jgi:hypothetical protein
MKGNLCKILLAVSFLFLMPTLYESKLKRNLETCSE